ncbi:MAG: hypothetical protein QM762_25330 [Chryseolinea sp.]
MLLVTRTRLFRECNEAATGLLPYVVRLSPGFAEVVDAFERPYFTDRIRCTWITDKLEKRAVTLCITAE